MRRAIASIWGPRPFLPFRTAQIGTVPHGHLYASRAMIGTRASVRAHGSWPTLERNRAGIDGADKRSGCAIVRARWGAGWSGSRHLDREMQVPEDPARGL